MRPVRVQFAFNDNVLSTTTWAPPSTSPFLYTSAPTAQDSVPGISFFGSFAKTPQLVSTVDFAAAYLATRPTYAGIPSGSLYEAPKRPVFGGPTVSKTMSAAQSSPATEDLRPSSLLDS